MSRSISSGDEEEADEPIHARSVSQNARLDAIRRDQDNSFKEQVAKLGDTAGVDPKSTTTHVPGNADVPPQQPVAVPSATTVSPRRKSTHDEYVLNKAVAKAQRIVASISLDYQHPSQEVTDEPMDDKVPQWRVQQKEVHAVCNADMCWRVL